MIDIGIDEISGNQLFDFKINNFNDYAQNRHSIRLYDCKSVPIDITEIIACIKVAQKCPSACNRQSVRVKIVVNKDLIEKICEIQGGSKGFGDNAGALLIITSDISLYEPTERRIPMFDCGLFTMNLVYALLDKKIGTCILNGSFSPEREDRIRKMMVIPKEEMFAAAIVLSKVPENENVKVAHSCKRDVNQIIDIVS